MKYQVGDTVRMVGGETLSILQVDLYSELYRMSDEGLAKDADIKCKIEEFSNVKELLALEEKDLSNKKKDKLKSKINTHLEKIFNAIDKQGKLDYFDIIIKNHKGNITAEFVIKDKFKAY